MSSGLDLVKPRVSPPVCVPAPSEPLIESVSGDVISKPLNQPASDENLVQVEKTQVSSP